jgi:hypothetical protein
MSTVSRTLPCVSLSIWSAGVTSALRAAGAEVLTMRLPDPGRMLGMLAAAGHHVGPAPGPEPASPQHREVAEALALAHPAPSLGSKPGTGPRP